jgi:hypothetical protein
MIKSGTVYGIIEWQNKEWQTKVIGVRLHLVLYDVLIVMIPFWTAASTLYVIIATLRVAFALFSQINHLHEFSIERGDDTVSGNISDPRIVGSWVADQAETSNNLLAELTVARYIQRTELIIKSNITCFPGLNDYHLHVIAPVVQQLWGILRQLQEILQDLEGTARGDSDWRKIPHRLGGNG